MRWASRVLRAFRARRDAGRRADAFAALNAGLIAECAKLARENFELRRRVLENTIYAARYREQCAARGVDPEAEERLQ